MESKNETIVNLHNLLIYDAQKTISAEVELKTILPRWINKAVSLKLKSVLQKYLGFVEQHLQKLENVFEGENILPQVVKNKVMLAFVEEIDEKLSQCTDSQISDASLLAGIQTINHFKISAYGTSASFAKGLQMGKQAEVFHLAEVNEKQIDDRLSQLAEHEINMQAVTPIFLRN